MRAWLGRGRGSAGEQPPEPVQPAGEPGEDRRERRRRQLIGDIGSFLIAHKLEVTAQTLAIAHDVISGGDQRLASLIEQRVAARQPVTWRWIEEVGARHQAEGQHGEDGQVLIEGLMGRLQSSIDEFSTTTLAARSATNEYNSALQAQVDVLDEVSKAGTMIDELAAIARIMLDRTREIEFAMERSEARSRALRKDLEDARREAARDHLTGLPNRRAFEAVFAAEYAAAKAAGEPLCVAFCDIDCFKRINDIHGHAAGDRVLKAAARTLAAISDECCHVARHGGEEFVVLLRGKTLDEACAVLDAARERMAGRRLVNRANDVPFGQITFSGGVADVIAASDTRAALAAADEALFRAKRGGRNRICREDAARLDTAA